jgi:6-phosphogluconolactonase/glucosamine-6-phosphate isomerase/deaminase
MADRWQEVVFVLMDEQVDGSPPAFQYVACDDAASYEAFARRNLLDPLRTKLGVAIPVTKPHLATIKTCTQKVDLLILALGVQGNYANVMPGTPLNVGWHVARLTTMFQQVHTEPGSGSYEGASFREYGMSLGPQQVLTAGEVLVIVSGYQKHDLAERLLAYDGFDPAFPISVIYDERVAPRVTLFITEDVGISPNVPDGARS